MRLGTPPTLIFTRVTRRPAHNDGCGPPTPQKKGLNAHALESRKAESQTSQEIPCIIRNPKRLGRIQNNPQPVLILSQNGPVHPLSSLCSILPPVPMSSKWSLSFRLFPY